MKKFNAFQIKIFLIILMVLDNVSLAFSGLLPIWIHPLTRGVAPMFGYFVVEGYYHTRDRKKYGMRLLSWAIFMQIGNIILNNMFASKKVMIFNNMFATLFVGFAIISMIELSKKQIGFKKVALIILITLITPVGSFVTEGGLSVVPFMIVTYLFRGNMKKTIIGYLIVAIPVFILNFQVYPSVETTVKALMFNSDFLTILAIPTILLYDGERGLNNKFSKYGFYVFYVVHLWMITVLQFILS